MEKREDAELTTIINVDHKKVSGTALGTNQKAGAGSVATSFGLHISRKAPRRSELQEPIIFSPLTHIWGVVNIPKE